jgi:hypothetical protein
MSDKKNIRGTKTETISKTETETPPQEIKDEKLENLLKNLKNIPNTEYQSKRQYIRNQILKYKNFRGNEINIPNLTDKKLNDEERKNRRKTAVRSRLQDLQKVATFLKKENISLRKGQDPPKNPTDIINSYSMAELNNKFIQTLKEKTDEDYNKPNFYVSVENALTENERKEKEPKPKIEKPESPIVSVKGVKKSPVKKGTKKEEEPAAAPAPAPKKEEQLGTPPVMSPDQRDEQAQAQEQEEEEEEKEETKQEETKEEEKEEEKQEEKQEEGSKRKPKKNIQTFKSKMDSIPESRLGTQGKEISDLIDDIKYFLKEFPSQLKNEKKIFSKLDKNNKDDLIKLHSKIASKLKPNISSDSSKKVGVVINAESYIRDQMKKLLEENVFSNLKPADIVIDAGGSQKIDNNDESKDIGNFEVKETPDGGLAAKREGIYRYLPTENEQPNESKKKKYNKLKIPPPQERNKATGAIKFNKQNPFKRPQKTLKLKYLY